MPPLPENASANRLGLARWLVDENNPLTSRVTVNRAWEQFFGRGIVETSEDFGSQGAAPSHPELLDWLATEFVKQGWSQKKLHRLIVLSATYRQNSNVTPGLQERDPYNRLLARGPRFRVEAEMVRDLSLTASGLLSRKLGGPSVMPPQPDGIWRNPYSAEKWTVASGEDRYRRGLYTFLRRTSPYPAMMTFDATSREVCTVRRVRTNTPLQSLTLLNDDAAMEMARALAKRMALEANGDLQAKLEYGFRLCQTRRPNAAELARLTALFNQQLANYKAHPQTAEQLMKGDARELPAPELAEIEFTVSRLPSDWAPATSTPVAFRTIVLLRTRLSLAPLRRLIPIPRLSRTKFSLIRFRLTPSTRSPVIPSPRMFPAPTSFPVAPSSISKPMPFSTIVFP